MALSQKCSALVLKVLFDYDWARCPSLMFVARAGAWADLVAWLWDGKQCSQAGDPDARVYHHDGDGKESLEWVNKRDTPICGCHDAQWWRFTLHLHFSTA